MQFYIMFIYLIVYALYSSSFCVGTLHKRRSLKIRRKNNGDATVNGKKER